MEKKDTFKKIFDYSIGCLGLIGVLATVIILFLTIKSPSVVVQLIQSVSDLPTSTPAIIKVTSEARVLTALPTEPPLLYPTHTPYPTRIVSLSTATPEEIDTPPGTVLEVGQTWRQGESELSLTEFILRPSSDPNAAQIYASWKFRNISPQDIVLTFGHSNFTAQTNLGNQLKTLKFYTYGVAGFYCDDVNIVVRSSEVLDFSDMCGPGTFGYKLPIVVDLGNKQISEVIVTANEISSIRDAKWKIPIFH